MIGRLNHNHKRSLEEKNQVLIEEVKDLIAETDIKSSFYQKKIDEMYADWDRDLDILLESFRETEKDLSEIERETNDKIEMAMLEFIDDEGLLAELESEDD